MKKIELFEPAMCCSTGVCGPSVDQNLLMITSAFDALQGVKTIEADRYNLSNNPDVFSERADILAAIKDDADAVYRSPWLTARSLKRARTQRSMNYLTILG